MSQKIIIDDYPNRRPRVKPNSTVSETRVKASSPKKKRDADIQRKRHTKQDSRDIIFRPESGTTPIELPTTTAHETSVTESDPHTSFLAEDPSSGIQEHVCDRIHNDWAPCAICDANPPPPPPPPPPRAPPKPIRVLVQSKYAHLFLDPQKPTEEEREWAKYLAHRDELIRIGASKEQQDAYLSEKFPRYHNENRVQPQSGLMNLLGLSVDSSLLDSTVSRMEGIAQTVSRPQLTVSVDESVNVSLDKLSSCLNELMVLILLVSIVIVYKPSTTREKTLVAFLIVGVLASRTSLLELWKNSALCEWLTTPLKSGVQPQAFSLDDTTTMISGLINSYIVVGAGKKICDPTQLAKVIGSIGRTTIGVTSIMKALHLLTAYIHACIDKYYMGNPWFVKTGHCFIDEFLKEAGDIILAVEEREFRDLQSSLDRVRAAIAMGENVQVKIPGSSETTGLRMQVNNALTELKRIKKNLLASSFKFGGIRPEPASLLMRGDPGVGKSQAMQHIAHAINALTLNDQEFALYTENPGTSLFNRQAENVFWDGYKPSMNVVFFDDILQARDIQGNPDNEAMNVIRAVNIFENQLHCAEITQKGNTNFRSNFVIANTNARNFRFDSIHQPAAFMRRWDIVVDVIPRREYCIDPDADLWKRRFDPAKLPVFTEEDCTSEKFRHLIGHTQINPEMCEFHLQKLNPEGRQFIPSDVEHPVLNFKELVMMYYSKYCWKRKNYDIYLKDLNETLETYRAEFAALNGEDSEIEVEMEQIVPQINMDELPPVEPSWPTNVTTFAYYPSPEFQKRLDELRSARIDIYEKVDLFIKYLFVRSIVLGRHLSCDEACWLALSKFNVTDEPWNLESPQFFEEQSELILQEFFSRKIDRDWFRERALLGIKAGRKFIADSKSAWSNSPSWATWLYQIYQMTFAHAIAFKDVLKDFSIGCANLWLKNYIEHPFLTGFFTTLAIRTAFEGLRALLKMILPKKEEDDIRYKIEAKAIEEKDESAIKAITELEKAQAALDAAHETYKKATAHIELKYRTEEASPESDERTSRVKIHRSIRPRAPAVRPEGVQRNNENLNSIMNSIVKRNVFTFYVPIPKENRGPGKTHENMGHVVNVSGRIYMMPHHFLSVVSSRHASGEISGDDECYFKRSLGDYVMTAVTVDEVLDGYVENELGEQMDLAMISLPLRTLCVRSCVKFFATREQHRIYQKVDAVLFIPSSPHAEIHAVVATKKTNLRVDYESFEPYTVREAYEYTAHSGPGDCGSLLYVNDRHKTPCIIGMHVAGTVSQKFGFSASLCREFVEDYINMFPENVRSLADCPPHIEEIPGVVLTSENVMPNMYAVGEFLPNVPYPRSVGRSKIVPSHIHGKVSPPAKFPARLKPFYDSQKRRIDPNAIALSKYGKPDIYIDPILLHEAVSRLWVNLKRSEIHKVTPEVYSQEVAILGDDSGFWNAIPRTTSAGYPWNCMSGSSTKTRFWGTGDEYDLSNPEAVKLSMRVVSLISKAAQGKRSVHLYTDCLKDERRSPAKVEAGLTRLISACPVDLLIAFRMYFGAFQKWCVANRIHNGMAIGIDEHSPDWNIIALKLNRWGDVDNKGAGDYAGFDMCHKHAMGAAVLGLILQFYGEDAVEENKVRTILWQEITNSYHVNEGTIFEWFFPLPSGAPPTMIFNCVANLIAYRACWQILVPGRNFEDHVYVIVLGDDNAYAVDPAFKHIFTEKAIAVVMKRLGYDFTPEDKELAEHRPSLRMITDISFLKRKWRKSAEFGGYVGPLDLTSILDMLNWQKDGASTYGDCDVLVNTAIEELGFHEPTIAKFWINKIVKVVEETEGLTYPKLYNYNLAVKVLRERLEGGMAEPRFITDYGELSLQNEALRELERFDEQQGVLFNITSRAPYWRPQSSSGNLKVSGRLIQRSVEKRIATTTNKEGNSLTDQSPLGQSDQGVFETSRTMREISDQSSDTTKSNVDAETPITQIVSYTPLNPGLLDSARTGVSQDVAAFLAKPIALATGNFTTTDTYAAFNWLSDGIPQSVLSAWPLWSNKLSGNYAFKGTLHLSLQSNATRFQQGRYGLFWVPSGGGLNYEKFRRMHAASLTQATQLPHVELDLNCDSEATLVIPQITAQGWASLDASTAYLGNNGSVFLTAYEPLAVAAGALSCSWTLFAHWSDVEVAMPIQPQSGARAKTRVRRKIRVEEVEQDSQGVGPLSSGLVKVSKAAAALSGIPFISSVAGPLSWATDLAAQVASAFGWSRPHNAEHAAIMQRFITPKYSNSDVVDNSTVLAGMDSNGIEELPGFAGTNIDEMSIPYITSISSYFNKVTWTSSQGQGHSLMILGLDPRQYYSSNAIAGVTYVALTPLSFMSSFFSLYRGSLKLTVKMVKTEFHTGRLLVSFKPYDWAAGPLGPASMAGSAYEHREIIDVRNGNEFTLEFPFMSLSPYRSTAGPDAAYGAIYIYVLNTLEAPDTVSQDITLLFEMSAGKDFELAEPADISGAPTQTYIPQMGVNVCEIVSEQLGNAHGDKETNVPARLCIGERFTSVRQMLKRFSLVRPGFSSLIPSEYLYWLVWKSDMTFLNTDGLIIGSTAPDTYAWFQACYALQRGGLRVKVVPIDSTPGRAFAGLVPFKSDNIFGLSSVTWSTTPALWTNELKGSQKPQAIFDLQVSGGMEVQVPYYSRTASSACSDLIGTRTASVQGLDFQAAGPVPRNALVAHLPSFSATTPIPLYMRAASEDFSFGLFVSVPLITGWAANYTA